MVGVRGWRTKCKRRGCVGRIKVVEDVVREVERHKFAARSAAAAAATNMTMP